MISYFKIEEYVTLCQREKTKKTPLDKIKSLTNARIIMCEDLMEMWRIQGASDNWVRWWWEAVKISHHNFFQTLQSYKDELGALCADRAYYERLFEKFIKLDIDNFIPWVNYLMEAENNEYVLLETVGEDVGPGHAFEYDDFGEVVKGVAYQEEYKDLNKRFPLQPTEERPTVAMMDVYFCELLKIIDQSIEKLSRDAFVDGQVKKPQDALPHKEYRSDNFVKYFTTPPPRREKMTAFEFAVRKMKDELYNFDADYCPPPEDDDDVYPDYDNDNNYEKADAPSKEVKTIVIHEFEARKTSSLSELPAQLESYLDTAKEMLEISDKGKQYQALGRLYDIIDKENGGYIDEDLRLASDEIESDKLAENLGLIEPYGKRKKTEILKRYLQRVKKLISEDEDITDIGDETTIVEGWSWDPVEGYYPAVVILEWLITAIRQEMRNLHRLVGDDIPKHRFLVHGHWDTVINDDDTAELVYVEERKYVTDDDRDKSSLPSWITGESCERQQPQENPIEENETNKVVEKEEEQEKEQEKEQEEECTPARFEMSEDYARYLYTGLHDKVDWLVEPLGEKDFVSRITSWPPKEKIKLKQLNQIKHVARHYIFSKKNYKNGKGGEKFNAREYLTITQLFDCKNGDINNFNTAKNNPRNSEKLDVYMRGYKEKKRKRQGEK